MAQTARNLWKAKGDELRLALSRAWAKRAKDDDIRKLRSKAGHICHEKYGYDAVKQLHTPEAKRKAKKATQKFTSTPEFKLKQSLAQKRVWQNPEYRQRMSMERKARHLKNPEILFNQLKPAFRHPNLAEKKLDALLQKHFPSQWRYTGNHGLVIGGCIPDFANVNGVKAVIELFGEHWHPAFDMGKKIYHYNQYGFSCLVIWEDELKYPEKVVAKIKKFSKKYEAKVA
jgi:hypothetical protein